MNFKLYFISLFLLFITTTSFAQFIEVDTTQAPVINSYWKAKNTVGFDMSEISFLNWNAGGQSSISGLLKGDFNRVYKRENYNWLNELIIRYGVNKQDGSVLKKTDDVFQFNSTFGYRKDTLTNWFHSIKFNFNTQFTNGYKYPNTDLAISKPLAPAYTFFGMGAEYNNKEDKINLYFSPLTLKNTLVLDRRLADQGAFGVDKAIYDSSGNILVDGKRTKTELGILITSYFEREIANNINFENRLSLYSDYINNFGNIDVDWQFKFDLVVNEYVRANIGLHLIYDDDIKSKKELNGIQVAEGPKIQLKQMLGIGLVYNF